MDSKFCPVCGGALVETTLTIESSEWRKGESASVWSCEDHGFLCSFGWIPFRLDVVWDLESILFMIAQSKES